MCFTAKDTDLEDLYRLKGVGIKLGLDRMRKILAKLGDPQDNYKIIHVGGTNGKGSVCRFINSILVEAGYRVGLYTSPHLVHFRERFLVNNSEISEKDLRDLVAEVLEVAEGMEDEPTFFEVSTAVAFLFFSEKDVDLAVIEVGMGGRCDATNVVKPEVVIITDVSLDHMDYLGNDIRKIAEEKAGIIKEGIPVVTSAKDVALDIIGERARAKGCELISVDGRWERIYHDLDAQIFRVDGLFRDYLLETSVLGRFQGENIALSTIACEKLQMLGIFLPDGCIERGIRVTRNPGRMEILSKDPIILVDGAHNPRAMGLLAESIREIDHEDLVLVIGVLKDKDVDGMIKEIAGLPRYVVTTEPESERAMSCEDLAKIFKKFDRDCEVFADRDIGSAIERAMDLSGERDMICVTGSLYLVGKARDIILGR